MANVFRADHVGTFVKPEALLAAEAGHAAGTVDAAGLRTAQDAAIADVLTLQKTVVMTVVTDGELRRAVADQPYASAIAGVTPAARANGAPPLQSNFAVSGKLAPKGRLTAAEVGFIKSQTQARFKVCLASPSSLALRWFRPGLTDAYYRSVTDLATALGDILRAEVEAVYGEGALYVQLNCPAYDALFEGAGQKLLDMSGAPGFEELLAVDAAVFKAIKKPAAAALAVQLPRLAELNDISARYERLVGRVLEALPIDRVVLEYGEPQPHDFEGLRGLAAGRMAALGLVRTVGEPEQIGALIDRLEQAGRIAGDELSLALSPRRGFANAAGQPVAAQLEAQRRCLLRTSEVVQQFFGLEL